MLARLTQMLAIVSCLGSRGANGGFNARYQIGGPRSIQRTGADWQCLRSPGKNVYLREGIDGRMSTNMTKDSKNRRALLQGTLDMLILRTLLFGPAHGHQIAKHIQRTTEEVLQVEHGSLYPALHRLERKGWVTAKWETAGDRNRQFKFYRLTAAGKKQLSVEESKWRQVASAISRVMSPAAEN
jgi:PadR family transcriptional regulator, regulatory protein PadR